MARSLLGSAGADAPQTPLGKLTIRRHGSRTEPTANPYLYMASQILSGLDGIDRSLDPGASADTPYETKASLLPTSLREAVFALKDDPFFRAAMGEKFVDYYVFIKNAEIERFQSEITAWEQREYFEMF
jgi:glutamine synthetase